MTRVLMFVPQYPYPVTGGLEKQAHELARALVGQGVPVRALSGAIADDQPRNEQVDGVAVTRIPWSRHKLKRVISAPSAIAYQMWRARKSFDVVHLHQHSWVSLYVILVAQLLGKATLTKLAGIGEFGLPGLRRSALGRVKQAILLSSDAVVAMSPHSVAELAGAGYPSARILCSPNGIALLNFRRQDRTGRDAPCQIVFVGRLSEEKQLDVLLDAWASLGEDRHSAHLHVWGEGSLDRVLRQRAADLKIERQVTFAGQMSNVPARLAEMDAFVLPSRTEGNSNAILEAMAAGLPIVSTPVGGTPMQVGPLGRPLLCEPGDVLSLRDALATVIRDREFRQTLGTAMRRRAEQHFDIEKIAATYGLAYQTLGAHGRRANMSSISNAVVLTGDH